MGAGCFSGCCCFVEEEKVTCSNSTSMCLTPLDISVISNQANLCVYPTQLQDGADKDCIRFRDVPDDQLSSIEKLEKYCPGSTEEERIRFLSAKKNNYELAREQLSSYIEWRREHFLDEDLHPPLNSSDKLDEFESCATSEQTVDELDWHHATDRAIHYLQSVGKDSINSGCVEIPQLARIVTLPGSDDHLRCSNGDRILHLLMAKMDPNIASDMAFALTVAFYLDRKLFRDSMEKLTIVIDVRGGNGWANPKPMKLISFILKINHIMERNFPERLSKLVLFPMPSIATATWKIIRAFLDPTTAAKITVISGSSAANALPPYKYLNKHLDRTVIDRMEEIRLVDFVDS